MSDSLLAQLRAYALAVQDFVQDCTNEEQTKLTLVNRYLELLGFDVRNPKQVVVEYQTDIGKSWERVDYAVLEEGKPAMLIEAKSATVRLTKRSPTPQLRRYAIDTPSARYVAITNGVEWEWYFKNQAGGLAERPFLVVEALRPRKSDADWLSKLSTRILHSDTFQAARAKYLTKQFIDWFEQAQHTPSDALLRLVVKEIDRPFRSSQLDDTRAQWISACDQARENWLQERLERAQRTEDQKSDETEVSEIGGGASELTGSLRCQVHMWNGETKNFSNATELMLFVVEYCASQHREGEQAYLTLLAKPLPTTGPHKALIAPHERIDGETQKRYYSGVAYKGYRIFKNLSNSRKLVLINSLLSSCTLNDGSSPVLGQHLEIKLPNTQRPYRRKIERRNF